MDKNGQEWTRMDNNWQEWTRMDKNWKELKRIIDIAHDTYCIWLRFLDALYSFLSIFLITKFKHSLFWKTCNKCTISNSSLVEIFCEYKMSLLSLSSPRTPSGHFCQTFWPATVRGQQRNESKTMGQYISDVSEPVLNKVIALFR